MLETLSLSYLVGLFPVIIPSFKNFPMDFRDSILFVYVVAFAHGLKELSLGFQSTDVRPSRKEFIDILMQSPSLQCLVIEYSGPAGNQWESGLESIILEELQELELSYMGVSDVVKLLDCILFLKLKSLTLTYLSGMLDDFTDTSNSRFKNVEFLRLKGIQCSVSEAIRCLETFPKVQVLHVNFHEISICIRHVFRLGSLLPSLHTLEVIGLNLSDIRLLLEDRKHCARPIKKLYLDRWEELIARNRGIEGLSRLTITVEEPIEIFDETEMS
ncbi:hypothetical protein M422DRAFT_50549 [Sphaerobolus stellatus SS14]|uniref:Unplaced genomic scaffold SPHSTscaffold_94, whole genome shotgun sequence n=1 Tax=Sphaerobolus stellatus (strain SS14) TaxID=990650 RepID=A0A0C9VIV2_SPHS4|nr:hypothetical protein M422DRAFT_50549 [Sphaerobolus stellatus SS14]